MLAGHFAPALALRRLSPRAPLWALFGGAVAVDLGFFLLGFFGVETARLTLEPPRVVVTQGVYTHSLGMGLVWSALFGALAGRRWGRGAGLAVGAAVLSHWFADVLVHTPDMPLGLSMDRGVGLSLWMRPTLAWGVEVGLLAAGWALLRGALPLVARPRLDGLVGVLIAFQTLSAFIIPTPLDPTLIGASGLAFFGAMIWLARRVDRRIDNTQIV